ncbi:CBS domain-containing protein [Natronococcus occultus]|uniref:Putative transcriptional regulator, contains C-terminal CBS domains n=1 Tax=Natronococcus occultus SP4 TaxID=694430 RepID=L0K3M9_9EURY|nr:CBS domain-containing protein [Natronococcus occultus]AGB38954.1 putative transcriptional regulator, contains C-terminal CBS domains [Natronococcus occultus SP4]
MPVGELGPEDVVTAQPDDDLETVAEQFAEENVGAVVVTEDEEPVGILTDRDVALAVPNSDDVGSVAVEDAMTADPAILQEDDEAIAISRAIEQHNARRFPVVDDDGALTGIVTLDDLVATIGEQLDDVAETVEVQSPGYSP